MDTVYVFAEHQAEFEGGMPDLMRALQSKIKFPSSEHYKKVDGKVFVRFMIDENGQSHYHHVIKGLSKPFNTEALRVCKLLQTWIPGNEKGRNVKSWFILPIYFKIES